MKKDINTTMYDFVLNSAEHTRGDALAFGNKRISFVEFTKEVDNVAGRLTASGIGKGDCIAICLPNIPQSVIAFYACSKIGAIASMVHPKTSPNEFEKQLKTTRPKLALLTEINYFAYKPLLEGVKIVFCSLITGKGFIGMKKAVEYTSVESDGSNTAVYMHSGGTTGASKTVVLSHRSFNALVLNLLESMQYPFDEHDTMLAILPLFHGFGLSAGVHMSLCSRMAAALVPVFKPKKVVSFMNKQKINVLSVIPRMMQKILEEPSFSGEVVKRIRKLYVGGDNLNEKLRVAFNTKLKDEGSKCVVQQGYGLTEMGSVCVLNFAEQRPDSIGQALLNVDAKVVGEDMSEMPCGKAGELLFKSEQMMDGYLADEETTKQSFVEIDGEKWLKTGDIVSMDKDGYIYFLDRKKRLIKISGMNVFPLEIEQSAKKLEEVLNCVATQKNIEGKPFICLYVVLKEGLELDEKLKNKFSDYFEKTLSHWSVPKYFEAVSELPHTNFGKVDFKEIEKLCNGDNK